MKLLLALLVTATLLRAAEPTGTPVPGYTPADCVHPYDAAKVETTRSGYVYWFADAALAEGKTVKLSVVGPHLASHPPHRHAEDEFFFVLEGKAEFYLDGAVQAVGPQTLLYAPSWHEHGIRNLGDSELRYLVMKKYVKPGTEPAKPAASTGTPVPGYSSADCIHPYDPAKAEPTPSGYVYWFADSTFAGGKTVKLAVVGPHLAAHPPHRHAEDEFMLILEGKAEFTIDGVTQVVGPQTLLYCPPWHEHGLVNIGDTDLRILVMKKYDKPVTKPAKPWVQLPGAAKLPGR